MEQNHGEIHETVHENDADGHIVNSQSLSPRGHPLVVKDENVSLDSRPAKQRDVRRVTAIVEVVGEEIEDGRLYPGHSIANMIQIPRDVGEFIDEIDEKKNDDDMIVESTAKCSIEEKVVEDEEATRNGEGIEDEIGPKLNSWRDSNDLSWKGNIRR